MRNGDGWVVAPQPNLWFAQNTFVPGVVELSEQKDVMIGGDDFKSGQTKMKSVMVDFLVSAGIKPTAIVSYNHLGNNDGKNLSAPQTFRSKVSAPQWSYYRTAVLVGSVFGLCFLGVKGPTTKSSRFRYYYYYYYCCYYYYC